MDEVADRVRALLPARAREIRMFGGLAFLLDDRMVVCAQRAGALLVRVDRAADAELMRRPGTGRLRMGSKELGEGWILVDAEALRSDDDLSFWIDRALEHHAGASAE